VYEQFSINGAQEKAAENGLSVMSEFEGNQQH
jgi:hypothetical protein